MKSPSATSLAFTALSLLSTGVCEDTIVNSKSPEEKWGTDWAFSGISTYAHLPHVKCLTHPDERYDIAIVGAPFDTAVSYRPGARFGPRAIRAASARILPWRGYNVRAEFAPFTAGLKIVDCGDIPITPVDNAMALRQMTQGFYELGARPAHSNRDVKPKLITLGGDHSLALPALRALHRIYNQPITVLHFDAHLDTWHPGAYPSVWHDPSTPAAEQQSAFNHGSMFWLAWQEGLLSTGPAGKSNGSASTPTPANVHAGLRTRLNDEEDNENDSRQGWVRIASDAIASDLMGPLGIAQQILKTIGTEAPVYLSIDIDVIDPGLAPGTGTPEPGGWTTRELIRVLRAIEGLNVVGADLVEVAPAYDGDGEQTALAGAQMVYEVLTSLVKRRTKDDQIASGKKGTKGDKDEL